MLPLSLYANEGRLKDQNRRKTERGWASVLREAAQVLGGATGLWAPHRICCPEQTSPQIWPRVSRCIPSGREIEAAGCL